MKIRNLLPALAVVPFLLTSCSTPPPPQAFHSTDNSALVIESLDNNNCQILGPAVSSKEDNKAALEKAIKLAQHDTAVVILENYTEAQVGEQFRDRGTPWFVELRGLGYQHIVFLQGKGVANPEGLITLAKYD